MQQSRASNQGGYRIKKQRNNFLGDHNIKDDEDVFKMSIHSSTNKSPGRGQGVKNKRNNSLANRHNDYERYTNRSKKSTATKGNISSSSLSGSGKKKQQPGSIKQFTNVKQLLMIKAYDKKLFRKVTGSNEANRNFLKLGDVRNDPFRKETFKVMIQNFKQITIRIRIGYQRVLNKILFQNTNTSAIVTLANVQPLLENVKQQADLMHQKVRECLEAHDSREFRSLLTKFQTFLNASQEIQEIILIVSQSKNKIDDLFKNLQKDKHLDEKVNNERKKGIKKVRNAVRDYGDDCVEAKILDKVEAAINQMADKTLEAYSKINGVRGLMMRIKSCLRQNKDFYELDDIVKLNKIFREVLNEAESYERFADRFMEEGDIVNDDLRQCILRYRQEVQTNKMAVYTMEMKFVSNIIETFIQTFEANYSVCNAVDSSLADDFTKMENLLQSVCSCLSDQNAKVAIKAMIRDTSHEFKNVQKLIKKLQKTPKSIALDTNHGLQSLLKISNLIDQYKKSVRQIIDRSDRTHRQITKKKVRRQVIEETDLEQKSIQRTIQISKKLCNQDRKLRIEDCLAFKMLKNNISVFQLASQIGQLKFYNEFKSLQKEIQQLLHNNQLGTLLQQLKTEDKIYEIGPFLVEVFQIGVSTTQSNLLKNLQILNSKIKTKLKDNNLRVELFAQRIFAVAICKGLDKRTIKKIDNNRQIEFPDNQHDVESLKRDIKYLKTVASLMPQVYVKDRINLTFIAMEQLIEGIKIAEDLKWNKDGHYFVGSQAIFKLIEESFQRCFKFKEKVQIESLFKKLKNVKHSLERIENTQKTSGYHETRVQKVLQIVKKYEDINKKFKENLKKIENLQIYEGYSQLVFHCSQYLKATLQSFFGTVNKTGNVFWLNEEPKETLKLSPFGQSIGLSQLKVGDLGQKINQKSGIKARKQQPKPKPQPKSKLQKKKQKSDEQMGQQIQENEQMDEVEDEMGEQINDQGQMQQEMEQQMQEQMEEGMAEEMQDQIPDGSMAEEMIVQADENIIDDFQDQGIEVKKSNNRPSAAKNKDHPTINSTNRPEATLNNSNPAKNSESPKKQEEAIVIKERKFKTVVEVFKYIQTLEDLQLILEKISHLRANFWGSIDLKTVQNYFNKESKTEIQKSLNQDLQKYCKAQFASEFLASIKESDSFKTILKEVQDLNLLKFAVFCQILGLNQKIYSCLIGTNKQLLRISIKDNEKWHSSQCVQAYIKKQLSTAGIKEEEFQKSEYIEQLIKNKKGNEVKFQFGDKNMLLNGDVLKEKLIACEKIIKEYQNYSTFPDGVNLQLMVLRMWQICVGKEAQQTQIETPEKFHTDFKLLSVMQNFGNGLYYLKNLRQKAKKTLQGMEYHGKKLKKLLKDLNKDNLLKTISEMVSLYNCDPGKVVSFEKQPVMYKGTSGTQNSSNFPIITYLLLPSKGTELTSQSIHNKIKQKPQLYAQNRTEINRILSLLQIQSHIWASPVALHIKQNRDQILKIIISHVSNGVVKDAHEQLDNLPQVNDCLKAISHQSLIFQYVIKEGKKMMDNQYNKTYYEELTKILNNYKNKTAKNLQVSDSIFESLFGMEDSEQSVTSQIFDFTETISLILKQKLFTEDWESILSNHIPTQNKIQDLKKSIDSEVRLLLSIVEDPIEINLVEPLIAFQQIDKKNDLVQKWLKQNKKKDPKSLSQLKICPCFDEQCQKQYTLYIGESQNHGQEYLRKLSSASTYLGSYIKKQENKGKGERKQIQTMHLGRTLKQICNKLTQKDLELKRDFINQFNLVHIIKKESKNKALADFHERLVRQNTAKAQLAKNLTQILGKVKKNPELFKIFNEKIHSICQIDLNQLSKDIEEQKTKLTSIIIDKTEYSKFGNWVVHVAGKIYKFPFYILIDKENKNDIVCILPGKDDQEVKKELRKLQLPTDFTVIEAKHSYKKIHLNQQTFTFKLDETCISSQELTELKDQNFGIKESQGEQKQTWALGIYRKINSEKQDDEYLLFVTSLNDKLLKQSIKVEININQFETKADIQIKIVEVKYQAGGKIGDDNIIRELKSQRHQNIGLNQSICASALSKWLKGELSKLKEKKQAELQEFLMRQQKQKQEEEAKLKQKQSKEKQQKEAHFVLSDEKIGTSNTIKQEAQNFLDQLYQDLATKNVYTPAKQKIKEGISKSKGSEHKIMLASQKNIEIKKQTQKTIQKMELNLNQEVKEEFHKIAENYLSYVQNLIYNRDKILIEVLDQSKKEQLPSLGPENRQLKHLASIMEQISKIPGFDQKLKPKIEEILKGLDQEKKEIIESIYTKNA